jgi:4-nitrophenyl phosphatase
LEVLDGPWEPGGGRTRATDAELVARARGLLLDWDGCVALGNRPARAAVRFLSEQRRRFAIVSNNSTHRPEDFAEILAHEGLDVPPERIVLAGTEALSRAQEVGGSRVMVIGDGRMKALARNRGLNLVPDEADLVVLLRDPRFSYTRLERAANCLRAGARLIVANPDLTHPGAGGRIVPETGALLAALMACAGPAEVDLEIVGKPSPRLFQRALRALGMAPDEAVMIGDNPATDAAGAASTGLRCVLVSGRFESRFEHLLGRETPAEGRALRPYSTPP